MQHTEWLSKITGTDTTNAIATKANIYTATLSKQIKRARLSPEIVIAIARAYQAPTLDALVSCGYLTETEAALKDRFGLAEALRDATDEQLLRELLRRVDTDGKLNHPTLTAPLDDTHPALA